jgi:hypothetical protein
MTLFTVVLTGQLLSCIVSARADTWWNKDYERARSVAQIVNRSARPVVISDYFTPSVLALSFYLDPGVALRLNLKCAQCITRTVAGISPLKPPSADLDTIFTLQLVEARETPRYRWINPKPFPPGPRPLNLFLAI